MSYNLDTLCVRLASAIERAASLDEIREVVRQMSQEMLGSSMAIMNHMSCGTMALYLVALLIRKLVQERRM